MEKARTRWVWAVSALGGIVLLWFWTAWLSFAANESAGPANASSVRFLVGFVAAQAAITTVYLLLLAIWRFRRTNLLWLLPWMVWCLVGLNVVLFSKSGFY